jgi:hypothetical protein
MVATHIFEKIIQNCSKQESNFGQFLQCFSKINILAQRMGVLCVCVIWIVTNHITFSMLISLFLNTHDVKIG